MTRRFALEHKPTVLALEDDKEILEKGEIELDVLRSVHVPRQGSVVAQLVVRQLEILIDTRLELYKYER